MSDPSLGSKRNLADYREEHPFDASDGFLGAPPGKKSNAEKAAPSNSLSSDGLGNAGNIRTPHRVATVTSDASGPHLLDLDNPAHGNEYCPALEIPPVLASVPVQPIIEEVQDAAPPLPVVPWQEPGPLEVFIPFREDGLIERAPRPSPRTTHYTVTIVDARDADENRRRTEEALRRVQQQQQEMLAYMQGRLHGHFDILNWCAHVLFQYSQAEQSPAPQVTAETMEIEDWGFMQIDDGPKTSQSHLALQNGPLALPDAPVEGTREGTSTERKRKRLTPETEDPDRSVLVVDSQGSVQAPPPHLIESTPVSLALQIGNIDEAQAQTIRQVREDALVRFTHAIEAPALATQLEAPRPRHKTTLPLQVKPYLLNLCKLLRAMQRRLPPPPPAASSRDSPRSKNIYLKSLNRNLCISFTAHTANSLNKMEKAQLRKQRMQSSSAI
jgi:hypothetical protein